MRSLLFTNAALPVLAELCSVDARDGALVISLASAETAPIWVAARESSSVHVRQMRQHSRSHAAALSKVRSVHAAASKNTAIRWLARALYL